MSRCRPVGSGLVVLPWPGLVALVAAAGALRLDGIGTWYWIDESLSIGLARHGLYEIPSLLLRLQASLTASDP